MRPITRRAFLRRSFAAGASAGLVLDPRRAISSPGRRAPADAVIHVHLDGGLSHLDSFDPKPDAPVDVRGPFGVIRSALDGEPFSALLPRLAGVADKLCVVRSATHTEADHERGQHTVLTGYQPSPAITYPAFGAVVAHQLGGRCDLPPYVAIQATNPFFGPGYLPSQHAPFAIGGNLAARDFVVGDLAPPRGLDAARGTRRRRLQQALDDGFDALGGGDAIDSLAASYQQAYALIDAPAARAAFDLGAESDARKDRYGRRAIGMACLLARRLVAAGVRYVALARGGFDHHRDLQSALPPALGEVDQAVAALLGDLDAEGRLEATLVLLTTEFGRTPRRNSDGGRDHWPRVFSLLLAGGGLRRGIVLGSSDASGAEPSRDPVHPADIAATVFHLLGIDPEQRLLAAGDRPIDLVRDGRILRELVA